MKVKLGDNVIGATGNQSGSTYKRGPYGFVKYNKQRTAPIYPRVFGSIQSVMADLSSEWRKLPSQNIQSWNNCNYYTIHDSLSGNDKPQNGFNSFISVNFYRSAMSLPLLLNPVPLNNSYAPDTYSIVPLAGFDVITLYMSPNPPPEAAFVISSTTIRNASIRHIPKQWKIIDVVQLDGILPYNIEFQYDFFFSMNWEDYPGHIIPFKIQLLDVASGIVFNEILIYATILP